MRGGAENASTARLLSRTLDEALSLLQRSDRSRTRSVAEVVPEASLLQQCLDLCRAVQHRQQPLRLIHPMPGCRTGCVAGPLAMLPNVQLLHGVGAPPPAPATDGTPLPTDLVALAARNSRYLGQDALAEVFRAALRALHDACIARGQRLVLVEDAGTLQGAARSTAAERPGLDTLLPADVPVLGVLLVCDPLDGIAAIAAASGEVPDAAAVEHHAQHALALLRRHAGRPRMRCEAWAGDPGGQLGLLCGYLDLPAPEPLAGLLDDLNDVVGSATAEPSAAAPRREILDAVDTARSAPGPALRQLCGDLGYPL